MDVFKRDPSWIVKLQLLGLGIFGIFFYSASIFIFLRGLYLLLNTSSDLLLQVFLVLALGTPPLIAGYGILMLRHWVLYALLGHVIIAGLSVLPLLFFDLAHIIKSTLLNNIIILLGLFLTFSVTKYLQQQRFGWMIVMLYLILLATSVSFQIYYLVG